MSEIQHIPVSKLKPLERNPRRISKEQMQKLEKSLKDDPSFLECRPILVNQITNDEGTHLFQVYAGNQRLQAAKKLKWKTVPCIVDVGLDPEVMKSRIIKDNKHFGEFDYDILNNEFDLEMLFDAGFTEAELRGAFDDIDDLGSTEEDCNDVLEPCKDEDAITKLGDVYELDGHIVICGDSTNPEGIIEHLEKNQPIIMVTDPPYGVEYDPNWRGKAGKGQKAAGKVQNDNKVDWSIAYSIFNGSIAYVWCASWFLPEVAQNLKNCKYELKSLIIWAKQNFSLSRGDYHWKHEPCWYAVRKGCQHNWKGDRKQTTVWEIANLNCFGKSQEEDERTPHSTQKPIECMARPIRNHTDEGDYCYDPFLGSGTTLIAAEQLKRKCIGVELSPAYVDIIINRWINWRKKHDLDHTFKKNDIEMSELQ